MTLLLAMLLLSATVLLAGAAVRLVPAHESGRVFKPLLALSGAYLFALTILHVLPEALRLATDDAQVGYWVLAGFFLQLVLEIASEGIEHGHIHHHEHKHSLGPVLLLASLVLHSALEGSILTTRAAQSGGFWPIVLGVALHHVPAAFALMAVLLGRYNSFRRAFTYLLIFALASPLGMLVGQYVVNSGSAYRVLSGLVAGNFLHISTTILFETSPEHRFNRPKMLATAAGVALALLVG